MNKSTVIWVVIAIIAGLWLAAHPPSLETLPSPGQEFSAVTGTCWGNEILIYGRPNYAADPAIEHMAGHPCYNPDQCRLWPPESYEGDINELYCCVPLGECVEDK